MKELPANIFVASHRRSGTHLAIDTIRNNILGVSDSFLTLETILPRHKEHISQEIFETRRTAGPATVIKTHDLPDMQQFPAEDGLHDYVANLLETAKIVYALRDGRDVMVSLFEYRKRTKHLPEDAVFSTFLRSPLGGGGQSRRLLGGPCESLAIASGRAANLLRRHA